MRTGTAGRMLVALALALSATVVAGCERQVSGPVLVLRLASPDPAQSPTGAQIEHLAGEVTERSGGTIRIEPVWDVTANGALGWDQTVARGVADGTWDMGLVPGRAWDALGVDSLRALSAPFLVTNAEALEAVLDSDLRDQLLAGLPEAGVVGLDLFPDALRHPFGYDAPLLGVADYQGETIRTPVSDTVHRLFAAYGATTTEDQMDSATQRGVESDYFFTEAQIATANVTFFAKTEVVAVSEAVRERLRPDQWAVLRSAAAATRRWLFDERPSDQEDARAFCAQGGTVVTASATQLAELEDAAEPVMAWLRRDDETRRLVDGIRSVVEGIDAEAPLTACPAEEALAVPDPELASLNGTYLSRVTAKQLREAGVTDPDLVRENSGRFTWVLDDGTYTLDTEANHFVQNPHLSGRYTYRDQVFTFYFTPDDTMTARLEIGVDGGIRFRDIRSQSPLPEDQVLCEGFFQPFTRVGGLPS